MTRTERVVFQYVVAALGHCSGYERIATPDSPNRTIRRVGKWAGRGGAGVIAPQGPPAPGHVGERWIVARTHR